MYSVLIVDDEFLARKLLQDYVKKIPEIELAGTAQNAFEAYSFCKERHVDIVLLDIHMPDLNGIELARTLKDVPAVIFTTAYSEYALESYEVAAVDYLLKPIALPRFMQAIEKAIVKLKGVETAAPSDSSNSSLRAPLARTEGSNPSTPSNSSLLIKADYKLYKINYDDLLYIEGQHEYVSFYTKGKRITALYSLKSLEEQLPRDKFIRVHKSYIVSIDNISEIEQLNVTVAGQKIPIGGSYRESLLERLGK
ncbi:MAG: response regulator transcription factor [Bacteroidales bacterium]|nr:response regulator transcription factor [Bacteroidales bacterium]